MAKKYVYRLKTLCIDESTFYLAKAKQAEYSSIAKKMVRTKDFCDLVFKNLNVNDLVKNEQGSGQTIIPD